MAAPIQIRRIIRPLHSAATKRIVYFLSNLSVRESLPLMNDADLMVGVFEVHVFHHVLGHVAGHTVVCSFPTSVARVGRVRSSAGTRNMAGQAGRIVGGSIANERLVRIMTGDAGEACIAVPPTAATLEPVRLKADICKTDRLVQRYIPPCSVTCAAEVNLIGRTEPPGIEYLF